MQMTFRFTIIVHINKHTPAWGVGDGVVAAAESSSAIKV